MLPLTPLGAVQNTVQIECLPLITIQEPPFQAAGSQLS